LGISRDRWLVNATMLFAIAALAGCSSGEETLTGKYRLVGTLSDTVPFVAARDPLCVHAVENGSAKFERDGSYSSSFRMSHVCRDRADPAIDDPGVKNGRYTIAGDTVKLVNDAGVLTGIGLRQGQDTILVRGGLHTLVYVRE